MQHLHVRQTGMSERVIDGIGESEDAAGIGGSPFGADWMMRRGVVESVSQARAMSIPPAQRTLSRQVARISDTVCENIAGPKGLRSNGTPLISAPGASAWPEINSALRPGRSRRARRIISAPLVPGIA
jgi:hypothetical protein